MINDTPEHIVIPGSDDPSNPMAAPVTSSEANAYIPLIAITLVSLLAAQVLRHAQNMNFMAMFMGFWLVQFSVLKLFDVRGFVENFSRYDVISSRLRGYGYLYPFIELALGLAYLGNYFPKYTSIVLLAISALGLLSVMLSRSRGKIYCACMGSVVRVPLGRVTAIENILMIVMAASHLAQHMNYWNNAAG